MQREGLRYVHDVSRGAASSISKNPKDSTVAFVSVIAACANCQSLFASNPLRVPSVVIDGERLPLCRPCVEWANGIRRARGLPTWEIFPDSYEAIDAAEVPFP